MEKQLNLFKTEQEDNFTIWLSMPERCWEKIETIFTNLIIHHLCASFMEVKEDEK